MRRLPLKLGHFVFALSLLSLVAAGAFVWKSSALLREEFPDVSILKTEYPVVHYNGKKLPPSISLSRRRPTGWTSIGDVSKVAVGAIVVSEDWAFYEHHGYDPNQIKEALKDSLEAGELTRGASTITQQVVKNVFLDREKHLWRKIKELYLATRLEESVKKARILEVYLNVAEWGEGVFGIRAAAQHYFGKEPTELTAKEGAFLAMLLPSPKRYSQSFRSHQLTEYARDTVDTILTKMTQAHYLTDEERTTQAAMPLSFEVEAVTTRAAASAPPPPPEAAPEGEPDPAADGTAL